MLRLTIRGYNRSDTAEDLGITRQTVQRYLKVVREKLDEAEMEAVLTGLAVSMGGAYYLNDLCSEKRPENGTMWLISGERREHSIGAEDY